MDVKKKNLMDLDKRLCCGERGLKIIKSCQKRSMAQCRTSKISGFLLSWLGDTFDLKTVLD